MMSHLNALAAGFLLVFFTPALADQISGTREPDGYLSSATPLGPETVYMVQGVSRSVLAAKQSVMQDPDELALGAELKALSELLTQLSIESTTPKISLKSDNGSKNGKNGAPGNYEQASAIESKLASLNQRYSRMKDKKQKEKQVESLQRNEALVAKAAEIHDEIKTALIAPQQERAKRLARLRERLEAGRIPAITESKKSSSGGEDSNQTPTISTIVRHR